ncbi:L-threonine synthase [bacterium A37T11]|nr:L-threonine synthase [bacterium A37T11]
MELYSTNKKECRVSIKEAIFHSLPADKGLYMPVEIPQLKGYFIDNLEKYSFQEIAFEVSNELIGNDIPAWDLKKIVVDAINFDAPLVALDQKTAVLELFHGPSFAFKDFGARFMSRIMAYFSNKDDRLLDVLVATSGDTGGAVALGFLGVPGTRVTILYPKGKVSTIQELQLTTNGKNIRALEIDGTFDDCQKLVKEAFNDITLNQKLRLTSANSINIARLIPQTFYYFQAVAQAKRDGAKEVVFSVPSGNFGNIGAGLLANKMGLPVLRFLAATNINDTVPRFLNSGVYEPRPSVQTLSNAMDVGNPSNWIRIMNLFNNKTEYVKQKVSAYRYTDAETIEAIKTLYEQYNYIACPHTAIAWRATHEYLRTNSGKYQTIFLSTAHPCKFPEVFPANIRSKIQVPAQVIELHKIKKVATKLTNNFQQLKEYLTET